MSDFYHTRMDPGRRYRRNGGSRPVRLPVRDESRESGLWRASLLTIFAAIVLVAVSLSILRACTVWEPEPEKDRNEEREPRR